MLEPNANKMNSVSYRKKCDKMFAILTGEKNTRTRKQNV